MTANVLNAGVQSVARVHTPKADADGGKSRQTEEEKHLQCKFIVSTLALAISSRHGELTRELRAWVSKHSLREI
jgi:hypothetical protein